MIKNKTDDKETTDDSELKTQEALDVQSVIAPEPTPTLASNAPLTSPALLNRTQTDWESERRKIADISHDALNTFLKTSVVQRADLLRDTLAVSVTVLFGGLTLYFTSGPDHSIIKTQLLLFLSLGVLVVGIVANLIARAEIIKHLQEVSFQIEKNYVNVYGASRAVISDSSTTNIDTVWRVERETPPFPLLRKRGDLGHTISIWTIIIAVVGMSLSFLVVIHL